MRKTIQKITGLIALSANLVNHTPAFASEAQADRKECDWHIGLKLHSKHSLKTITERFSMGLDFAVGPFIEWKPLNQIGIQTGLMYDLNYLLTGGFNWSARLVDGWSGKIKERNKSDATSIDVDNVNFYAISIPCAIRFYLGNDRQFALHLGTRLVIPLSKAKRTSYGSMFIGNDKEHTLATYWNSMMEFVKDKQNKSDKKLTNELEIKPHCMRSALWRKFAFQPISGMILGQIFGINA